MTYKTNDMWLAACFQIDGHQLVDIEVDDRNRAKFVLEITEGVDPFDYEEDYNDGRLVTSPVDLRSRVRDLAARVQRKIGGDRERREYRPKKKR